MLANIFSLKSTASDLYSWTIELMPDNESIYRDMTIELELSFPESWPRHPLIAKIPSGIYHPNVDGLGYVTGDVLRTQEWSPLVTALAVVMCLLVLLDNPDVGGEVVNEAALGMYLTHPDEYKRITRGSLDVGEMADPA